MLNDRNDFEIELKVWIRDSKVKILLTAKANSPKVHERHDLFLRLDYKFCGLQ